MNVLIAMLAGLAGGAVSAVAAGFLTVWICQALHVTDRDGGIGYAGLFMGILAGLFGMVITIVLTLCWRHQSAGGVIAQTPMALAGIIALGALGLWLYYNSKDHPIVDGAPPVLISSCNRLRAPHCRTRRASKSFCSPGKGGAMTGGGTNRRPRKRMAGPSLPATCS